MIERTLFKTLIDHLPKKEISVIVGPRQAGKTTLMQMLKKRLETNGEKTLFLSLDFESDQPYFQSQAGLLKKIQLELGRKKGYVFIDEIQRKENAGLFLKGIYDLDPPYKFIVSGSGSLELKEKIHESLVGRKRIFELGTISFEEFLQFKTEYRYRDKLSDFLSLEKEKAREILAEYLIFGGYPRVILEETLLEKSRTIDEIYRSYLERDLAYIFRIDKVESFNSLIKILAGQTGQLVNFSELSSTLGISLPTVKNYLEYARKTFIINPVTPFYRNARKEITKSPVIYFYDLGLRNYISGRFGPPGPSPAESGFLFQNLVFNLLKEKLSYRSGEIHFWRTKDKAEVDFVVETGRKLIPIEVKHKTLARPVIERPLRGFISKYEPEEAWIVNLELKDSVQVNRTAVHFIPYYELLFREI
jgi:predicted AAA+ superfamily ATPase